MATLLDSLGDHSCGGTLIAPDLILSAAHCEPDTATVQLGRYNLSDVQEEYESFVIDTLSTTRHPNNAVVHLSDGSAVEVFDFLVIKLFGVSSRPVVKLNSRHHVPFLEGSRLSIMGWGHTDAAQDDDEIYLSVLKEAEVRYVSNKRCETANGYVEDLDMYDDFSGAIYDDMLCAKGLGAEAADACHLDSGGPLIVKGTSAPTDLQLGITSWGSGCADSNFPGVYARVSNQWQWIRDTVCELSVDPPAEFGCNPPSRVIGYDNNERKIQQIYVRIKFDEYPSEQGFVISSLDDGRLHAYRPIGSFKVDPFGKVEEVIDLPLDAAYKFVYLDDGGDGFGFTIRQISNFRIHLGSDRTGQLLASGDGDFGFFSQHIFVLGDASVEETEHPTVNPTTEESTTTLSIDRIDDMPDKSGCRDQISYAVYPFLVVFLFLVKAGLVSA
mmetsp:Transcript_32511/g.70401  ORF Transcript_32511/g.70401 Transcript_32511/m.70401 type:complete len:441 (+) Transcript_32511:278-1600(+)